MADAHHMTFSEFLQQQERVVLELKQQLDDAYVSQVEDLLRGDNFQYGPEKARQKAEDVVLNKKRLADNDGDDDEEATNVNAIGKEWAALFDVALLCVNAISNIDKTVPIEQDRKARGMQFYNFVNTHSQLKGKPPRIHTDSCEAESYEMMKQKVTDFITNYGTRASIVSIIFNGHGTKEGKLCFHEGEKPHMSVFEKYFEDIVKKHRSPKNLPKQMEIIFAQCHAHVRAKQTNHELKVISFTNETKKKTYVLYTYDGLGNMTNAVHEELDGHAQVHKWEPTQK